MTRQLPTFIVFKNGVEQLRRPQILEGGQVPRVRMNRVGGTHVLFVSLPNVTPAIRPLFLSFFLSFLFSFLFISSNAFFLLFSLFFTFPQFAMADSAAKIAEGRKEAPKLSAEEIKERNRIALEARKQKMAEQKAAEASRPLPEGWRRVESRSRPGEFVYENIHTEERQAWFPEVAASEEASAPLVAQNEDDKKKEELKAKNKAALEKRKKALEEKKAAEKDMPLPEGWIRVESRSRPGEMVYENTVTKDRQAWFPTEPAVAADPKKAELAEKNKKALEAYKAKMAAKKNEEASKPLPEGWKRVESRSRPGEFVYENVYTEERQAWFPDAPAEKPLPEGWRKVESRSYPGEFVYENIHTLERQAWRPDEAAPIFESQQSAADRSKQQTEELGKAAPKNIICKCRALYDYAAENAEEEIDLLEGDIIAVEYKAANGWWVGINTRTQKNGIFPGTYVEDM
eukprot:m.83111 g.83111  ORF g.83111 m.83111 type:complete len:458 (+) comp17694_c0_seq3:130-1503(+)